MRKNQREQLEKELHDTPSATISEAHLNETIRLARTAYQARRQRRPVNLLQFVLRQIRFVAAPVWTVQGIVLLALCLLFQVVLTDKVTMKYAPMLLPVAAAFIAMTGLPFLARSFQHGMQEVEMTTRLSLSGLTLARLIVTGAGDAIALLTLLLVTFGKLGRSAGNALIYIVLPFLLASVVSLFIMNRLKGRHGLLASGITCLVLTGLVAILFAWMPQEAARVFPWAAAALCAVCAVALVLECRKLIKHIGLADAASAPGF